MSATALASSSAKPVVTRFAPSPTGFLHIGGARTALFNWLFARHHGGRYLLRIEDTDRARSTDAAIDAILDGLDWLGLSGDEAPVFQFARAQRHAEVAQQMLASGHAYQCYATPEELAELREQQRAAKQPLRYDGRWRDRDPSDAPAGAPFVIRLKAPREGETVIEDAVQGRVVVQNSELDDMILLRSDGTPTYMLAVVVDDNDMGVTHVIRGDDHLNNAFRQLGIIKAMGWEEPVYAHIPLIHGADGAKLSKRHGALGVEAYRDEMGYLPEAVRNYLAPARLEPRRRRNLLTATRRSNGSTSPASAARPRASISTSSENLNGHYIREADDARLKTASGSRRVTETLDGRTLSDPIATPLSRAMPALEAPRQDAAGTIADRRDVHSTLCAPLAIDATKRRRRACWRRAPTACWRAFPPRLLGALNALDHRQRMNAAVRSPNLAGSR
ncbi:MAG: glutamate--tRNA ligase [Sphingobium sp.]|nr:glutamate--tRNA ligase [Sphingobium sp.]